MKEATLVRKLKARALKIGGKSFQIPGVIERDLRDELPREDWHATPGAGARRLKMASRQCHENAARLALAYNWSCWTGLALSEDGCWRVHSWAMNKRGRIVETTTPRTHYLGVLLSRDATEELLG
jgi:hypothetical protein